MDAPFNRMIYPVMSDQSLYQKDFLYIASIIFGYDL